MMRKNNESINKKKSLIKTIKKVGKSKVKPEQTDFIWITSLAFINYKSESQVDEYEDVYIIKKLSFLNKTSLYLNDPFLIKKDYKTLVLCEN